MNLKASHLGGPVLLPGNNASNHAICVHCGSKVPDAMKPGSGSGQLAFCCLGCQTVYKILTAGGLDQYYKLKKQIGSFAPQKPVATSHETYSYLDNPSFKEKYSHENQLCMDFYLEGIHCAACLWLIEKLPTLSSGVESATLDIGRSTARIKMKKDQPFSSAARTLDELGYKPHPIEHNAQAENLMKKENRSWLIRIGVAGACAGNIMLIAIPLYSGVEQYLSTPFRWLSFALFLPAILYSAVPFFKNALASVRSQTISIDLPIVLAILFGTGASIAHLFTKSDHIYFDSLSALIFLLLASRFVLRRLQQNAFQSSHLFQFLTPAFAKKFKRDLMETYEVPVSTLENEDIVLVNTSEVVPADGTLFNENGAINCALLTGESTPSTVLKGDAVYSGTINEGEPIQVRVTAIGSKTRLGKILQEIESGALRKASIVSAADKTAKWFLVAIFIAAVGVFFMAPDFTEGFNRALALVIVTCPCALALATPLAMSVSLGKASKAGILIKGAEVLEKIHQAKNIALDKTGTLTHGTFKVLNFVQFEPVPQLKEVIYALEKRSKHLVAKAITAYLESKLTLPLPEISEFKEHVGSGVEGVVAGNKITLRALRSEVNTAVGIYLNSSLAAKIVLGDQTREESPVCIKQLRQWGLKPFILSGDNSGTVETVATRLGIPAAQALSCSDPESKKHFIEIHERTIMVGDGANDALALSTAFVGVAVHGSMEVSLRAADVYLTHPGLKPVLQLLEIAHETMNTIYRNFAFSLLYNLAGGIAAATGHVTPLFAALLMPLSAFTVFGSSLLGSRPKK